MRRSWSTSPLPVVTPRSPSNNQNTRTSFQDLQEAVKISSNPELPYPVGIYFTCNDEFLDIFPGLKQSVKAVLEGGTFRRCSKIALAASRASLGQMVDKVKIVLPNQLYMQQSQKCHGGNLDDDLRRIILWKDVYNTSFTVLAAVFAAVAFVAAKVYPVSLAKAVGGFAAAASVVSLGMGRRMDSHQDELMIHVKKNLDFTEAITGDNKLALRHLADIVSLVSNLQYRIKSILKKLDFGEAMESNTIQTELAALKLAFQKLETKVDRCSVDAYSSRQAVVQTVIKNWVWVTYDLS